MKKVIMAYFYNISVWLTLFIVGLFLFPHPLYSSTQDCSQEANKVMKELASGKQSRESIEHAIDKCKEPAKKGNAEAQYHLGGLYSSIHQSETDNLAYYWMLKAAKNGQKSAQYYIGEMYEIGDGVVQDFKKAEEWYTKAANQNSLIAQQKLGYNSIKGIGQPPDLSKGVYWYEKAANNNSTSSIKFLIKVYSKGAPGFPANKEKELYWRNRLIKKEERK